VAISIVDRANPYRTAWLRGEVAETRTGEAALELIDVLSHMVEPTLARLFELPFEPPQ
jgi:hypothetical protein